MWSVTAGAPGLSGISGMVISTKPDKYGNYPAMNFKGNFVGVSYPRPVSWTFNNVAIFEDNLSDPCLSNIEGESEILTGASVVIGDEIFSGPGIFRFGGLRLKEMGVTSGIDLSAGSHWKGGIHLVGKQFAITKDLYYDLTREFNPLIR